MNNFDPLFQTNYPDIGIPAPTGHDSSLYPQGEGGARHKGEKGEKGERGAKGEQGPPGTGFIGPPPITPPPPNYPDFKVVIMHVQYTVNQQIMFVNHAFLINAQTLFACKHLQVSMSSFGNNIVMKICQLLRELWPFPSHSLPDKTLLKIVNFLGNLN